MKYFLLFLMMLVMACGSASKVEKPTESFPPQAMTPETNNENELNIDQRGLQIELGLDRGVEDLGYMEKSFATCQVGYGYSKSHNCRTQNFIVIHFQLMCRDSEGTISTALTESDITPIENRKIKWSLKGAHGIAQTDSRGFGQIQTIATKSMKKERLKLATGPEFLYMRAGEIMRVVTPKPWCSP